MTSIWNGFSAPNLRHVRAFIETARCGSARLAADAIHLSQPAVTQAIARLEERLGARLFARHHAGMSLTPAGETYLARARRALDELAAADRNAGPRPSLERLATATQLTAVAMVVDARSFTGAARRLGVAEPTVHRAARDVERILGRTLFVASASGIEPTRDARLIALAASLAFEELRQGEHEVRELQGLVDGALRVGSLPLGRSRIVPKAVSRVLAAHPDVNVTILDGSYAELLDHLRHGRIDLIFGALRLSQPDRQIEQEPLFLDPLNVIVRSGHPFCGRAPDLAELAGVTWILPRRLTPARELFDAWFEGAPAAPRRIIECASLVAVRELLRQGDYAALLSRRQVAGDIAAGELAVLGPALPNSERPIGLTTRLGLRPTRLQTLLMDELRRVSAEEPAT